MTSYLWSDNICTSEKIIYHTTGLFWAIINCKNAQRWLEMVEKCNSDLLQIKNILNILT